MTAIALSILLSLAPKAEVTSPLAHRTIAGATIVLASRNAQEARDLFRLAHIESRWTPSARSSHGAAGIWQIIPRYHGTTCHALQTRPVHSALTALRTWRKMVNVCGPKGAMTCYQRGPYSTAGRKARGLR